MSHSRTLRIVVTLSFWLLSCDYGLSQEQIDVDKLLIQLRQDWKKLETIDEMSKEYDIAKQIIDKDLNNPSKPADITKSRVHVVLDLNNNRRMYSGTRDGLEFAVVKNPYYSFIVSRKNKVDWMLNRQQKASSNNEIDSFATSDGKTFHPLSTNHWGEALYKLLNKTTFKILSAQKLTNGNITAVFQYDYVISQLKKNVSVR